MKMQADEGFQYKPTNTVESEVMRFNDPLLIAAITYRNCSDIRILLQPNSNNAEALSSMRLLTYNQIELLAKNHGDFLNFPVIYALRLSRTENHVDLESGVTPFEVLATLGQLFMNYCTRLQVDPDKAYKNIAEFAAKHNYQAGMEAFNLGIHQSDLEFKDAHEFQSNAGLF